MPRRLNTSTIQITNVTEEQRATVAAIQTKTGESINALLKRLLAEEAQRLNIQWQDDDLRDWSPRED